VVLDAHPKGRHKRFSDEAISRLEALTQGSPEEIFFQALLASGVATYAQVAQASNLERDVAEQAAEQLLESNQLVTLDGEGNSLKEKSLVTSYSYWEQVRQRCLNIVGDYHLSHPLRPGIPLEELKSRLALDQRVFTALVSRLVEEDRIVHKGAFAWLPEHKVEFSPTQQSKIDSLLARFAASPFAPPTVKECIAEVGDDIYQALTALDKLLQVSSDVVFRPEDYRQAVADIRSLVAEHGSVTLAQARDHWGTTRRYVQALLEYMDQQGITIRVGDARKLRKTG
jgi:selenocysteine-specific elongation factor